MCAQTSTYSQHSQHIRTVQEEGSITRAGATGAAGDAGAFQSFPCLYAGRVDHGAIVDAQHRQRPQEGKAASNLLLGCSRLSGPILPAKLSLLSHMGRENPMKSHTEKAPLSNNLKQSEA